MRWTAILGALAVMAAACAPLPLFGGPTAAPPDLGQCRVGPQRTPERLYVLVQAKTTGYPVLGASLFSRLETTVIRLSADGRRLEAKTGTPGIGLASFPSGLVRNSADGRKVQLLDAMSLELRAELTSLRTSASTLATCETDDLLVVATEREMTLWRSRGTKADLIATFGVDGGPGHECGIPPVALLRPDGAPVLGGICRAGFWSGYSVVTAAPNGGAVRYQSPATEHDAPYALSPSSEWLYVAKPTQHLLWALRTADGTVHWRSTYGTPPPPAADAKRVYGGNSILVDPEMRMLYVTGAAVPGPAMGIWVMNAQDGSLIAHWLPDAPVTGTALSGDGRTLYVVSPSEGGSVRAIDTRTGASEIRIRDLGERNGPSQYKTVVGILIGR